MTSETKWNAIICLAIIWIVYAFYISIHDEPDMRDAISIRAGVLQIDKAR